MDSHIHDCTGPEGTCPCGYQFTVPPIMVSIEVFNGEDELVSVGFNTDYVEAAISALRTAANKLEQSL